MNILATASLYIGELLFWGRANKCLQFDKIAWSEHWENVLNTNTI